MSAANAPHREPAAVAWAALILASHRRLIGSELVPTVPATPPQAATDPFGPAKSQHSGGVTWEDRTEALYQLPAIVVAHDAAADPCFVYANAAAQALWGYPWSRFIGMPSRLSAPVEERGTRGHLLDDGRRAGVAIGRDLVRVAADGRRFVVAEVVLWNVLDASGTRIGQAATYDRWRWMA